MDMNANIYKQSMKRLKAENYIAFLSQSLQITYTY